MLITNYLSNKAFIKMYKTKVYGITGTLGSKNSRKFLKDVFNLDFVIIPRFKQ